MKRSLFVLLAAVALVVTALVGGTQNAGAAQTSRVLGQPQATATPQPDRGLVGLPKPTVLPSCGTSKLGLHGFSNDDCIYACQGANRVKIAGSGCAVPTSTATATLTPTPTVTSTP